MGKCKVYFSTFFCFIFTRNEAEVVQNLDEVYSVGTFAQIHEVQDLGDRLRLVIMAHRRIKIVNQILEDLEEKPAHGKIIIQNYIKIMRNRYRSRM